MMNNNINVQTPISLHKAGMNVLVGQLGAVDAMRFIRLFDNGYGDYTKERHAIFDDMSVDDIFDELRRRKA